MRDNSHGKHEMYLFTFILIVATLTGCATPAKPMLVGDPSPAVFPAELDSVSVFEPNLILIDLQTEKELDLNAHKGNLIQNITKSEMKALLEEKGFVVIEGEKLSELQQTKLNALLWANNWQSERLADNKMKTDGLTALFKFKEASLSSTGDALIIVSIKAKVTKEKGVKHSIIGTVDPDLSTTQIRAILFDASKSQILWINEVFLRRMIKPKDMPLVTKLLFSTFPVTVRKELP